MSKTAFLFPGQGSQSVGMLSALGDETVVQQTFQEASGALGYDLWSLIQSGPVEELNKTEITQPAILTASVALWRLWEQRAGQRPDLIAGHSLGEYSALTCAGVLSMGDAARLVQLRGQFMQAAVPEGQGAIAAVLGLDDEEVKSVCADSANVGLVEAVNFNAPGQVVIAGEKAAVDHAIGLCKEAGARRAMPLPMSVPSHCALMKPAAAKLADAMSQMKFHAPEIPIVNNVDVVKETEVEQIRDALVRQLYSPVRWVETIHALSADGVSAAYECGPGKVLAGLVKRIDKEMTVTGLEAALAN